MVHGHDEGPSYNVTPIEQKPQIRQRHAALSVQEQLLAAVLAKKVYRNIFNKFEAACFEHFAECASSSAWHCMVDDTGSTQGFLKMAQGRRLLASVLCAHWVA